MRKQFSQSENKSAPHWGIGLWNADLFQNGWALRQFRAGLYAVTGEGSGGKRCRSRTS